MFAWAIRALINVFYIILRPVSFQWWQGRRFPNHCIPVNWLSFSSSDFCWWNNLHPGLWQANVDVRLLVSRFPVGEHQLCCFILHISFPRVLCQPAVFAGTALSCAPLIFIFLLQPCTRTCSYLKHSCARLMAPHEHPCPLHSGSLVSLDARGFCGSSPFCWSYSGSLWICTIWQMWPLLAQWLQ